MKNGLVPVKPKHRLRLVDRLRGWHRIGCRRVRNLCGCEL